MTNREDYELPFWSPPSHEPTARRSLAAMDITPGLNVLKDMAIVVGREDCGSPRTALFRENIHRLLAGMTPATLADMEARYPRPDRAPPRDATAVPTEWRAFAGTCLRNRHSVYATRPVSVTAYYCSCVERHLRAADVGDVYAAFTANWQRAADLYWHSDALGPILGRCNKTSYEIDRNHAETLLRDTGMPDSPFVTR